MRQKEHSNETMVSLAKEKGIKFVSDNFKGWSELHRWECADGHQWDARPYNIKNIPFGKCPKCSKRARVTIEDLSEMVKKKGGLLLTENIQSLKSVIKIKCAYNHIWESKAANIRQGKWCHECGGSKPLNISVLHKLAEERGGRCLSTNYTNANDKYEWECSEGHIWKAKYGNIYWGNWCKQCISSLGERICRVFFEDLFGVEFPSSFPVWLRLSKKVKLELDGYNDTLKLAFEHQGEQHFNIKTQFIKSPEKLNERIKYDLIKKELCEKNGVILIEVPEVNNKIKVEDLKKYIKMECLKKDVFIPDNFDDIVVDYNKVYRTPEWRLKLLKQKEIAESKGGKCLSDFYKSNNVKLRYCCQHGHEWEATPGKILMDRWCPNCAVIERANNRRYTIELMKKIALDRFGKCLSEIYINPRSKLKWQCNNNHIWDETAQRIVAGSWCKICSSNIIIPKIE